MAEYEPNPRVVVGGNSTGLEGAIATFDLVGFLLARYETLALATADDRIDRACLKVLGALIATMNRETRTSWAGREYIASTMGMSAKSVSNYIYQLKCLGYLVSERRPTPQANNRVLMHYTLSKLSPVEIERAIESAISSIKGERNSVVPFPSGQEVKQESSRQDRNSVPARTGTLGNTSCRDGKSETGVPAGTGTKIETVPAPTGTLTESSRQDGHSNNNSSFLPITNTFTSGSPKKQSSGAKRLAKGTRIADDWVLPQAWGQWALGEFIVSADAIRSEGKRFHRFWKAQPGQKGLKLDWYATWQNWCDSDKRAWPRRQKPDPSGFDLLTVEPQESEHERQLALLRQRRCEDASD